MYTDSGGDQADGLRRLLSYRQMRVISVLAGQSGAGGMIANLAAALAHCGKAVRVLDKNNAHAQARENTLAMMSAASDVLLVNAALGLPGGIVLVGVDATASGITQSYAAIKRLAVQHARLQFEIVVKQVASEQVARTVFGNMAKLAQRDLAAELNYLGCIPQDDQQKRAAQMGKPVLEVYPTAASAQAYLSLTQKLLHLPPRPTEAKGGARTDKGERRIAAQLSQRQYAEQPTLLIT